MPEKNFNNLLDKTLLLGQLYLSGWRLFIPYTFLYKHLRLIYDESIWRLILLVYLGGVLVKILLFVIKKNEKRFQPLARYFILFQIFVLFQLFHSKNTYLSVLILVVRFLLLFILLKTEKPPKFDIENPTDLKKGGIKLLSNSSPGFLPLNKPDAGILIIGQPGSGKSYSICEPLLFQFAKEGRGGILYDYDFSFLTNQNRSLSTFMFSVLRLFGREKDFFCINFNDASRSHRINPFRPSNIKSNNELADLVDTFVKNLGSKGKEDFWQKAAISVFKSIFIFLRDKHPEYCSLPHALGLLNHKKEKILAALESHKPSRDLIAQLPSESKTNSSTTAGVFASLHTPISRLISPKFNWILSAHTILDIETKVLCLGNNSREKEAVTPVLSAILRSETRKFGHGAVKKFLLIDELPTIYITKLSEIPATVRKYGVSTVLALQNINQLFDTYGENSGKSIIQTLSNRFIGKSVDNTASWGARTVGSRKIQKKTTSTNGNKKSSSTTETEEKYLKESDFLKLKEGEFVGFLAGVDKALFYAKLCGIEKYNKKINKQIVEIPIVNEEIDLKKFEKNFQEQVESILEPFIIPEI